MSSRRNQVVRRRPDGRFDLVLAPGHRDAVDALLGELSDLLELAPDDPSTRRLHPPAYTDDPERDLGYQILAGDELRTSRAATIEAVRSSLRRDVLTEEELWSWLRALNALRLVVGTRLGIDDEDDHQRHGALDPESAEAALWDILDFASAVQDQVIRALQD